MGSLPDGLVTFDGLVRMFSTQANASDLTKLESVAKAAIGMHETDGRRVAAAIDALADKMNEGKEPLRKVAEFLRPKSGADLAQWLGLLVALLGLWFTLHSGA